MVKEILTAAGFVENKTFKETRFLRPPKETYAVFLRSYSRRGADDRNFVTECQNSIELYSYAPDADAESRIETALDVRGIPYERSERFWLDTEQLYQVVFDFDYIKK